MFKSSSKLNLSSDRVSITIRPYECKRPIDFHTT